MGKVVKKILFFLDLAGYYVRFWLIFFATKAQSHRGFQPAWCSWQDLLVKRALSQIPACVHRAACCPLIIKLAVY